ERYREEMERHQVDLDQVSAVTPVEDPVAMALLLSRTADIPPAWERLDQLCREKAQTRGFTLGPARPADRRGQQAHANPRRRTEGPMAKGVANMSMSLGGCIA